MQEECRQVALRRPCMAASRGPCGGKESSGQGFTIHSTNGIQNAPRPADHVHPTPVTGRRPTPAHYSHPPPKDHSQRYTCPCICTVATLVYFPAHHASSQVTWPERVAVAVACRCPARVRIQSNARDSEVRVSLQSGNVEELQPRLDAFLTATDESVQPFFQASTCIMPHNAAQGDTGSEMGLVGTDNHLCHLTTV